MDVGMQLVFASAGWDGITDGQVYKDEIKLALMAEELGFDVIWPAEHHFFDYSFCPDNTQLLSYLAAATERIDLGTAAVIMPWNDPLRIAEKVSMIDHFTNGRLRFGVGRGLARREFNIFRTSMDESRTRFDEAAKMIVEALETGFIEGDDLHPPANRAKMASGTPLTDADRWPWLDAIAAEAHAIEARGGSVVIACSALKRIYRDRLRSAGRAVKFLHLTGDRDTAALRNHRRGCPRRRNLPPQRQVFLCPGRPVLLDHRRPRTARHRP